VIWLLIAIYLTATADERQLLGEYQSRAECAAAAEAFVDANPAFDFDQDSNGAVIRPVVRSYVECVPKDKEENEEKDRDKKQGD
jgi:hypothetical protein